MAGLSQVRPEWDVKKREMKYCAFPATSELFDVRSFKWDRDFFSEVRHCAFAADQCLAHLVKTGDQVAVQCAHDVHRDTAFVVLGEHLVACVHPGC